MTKPAKFYQRPTDWVTEKRYVRDLDRLERLYNHEKEQRRKLEEKVEQLLQWKMTVIGSIGRALPPK